MKCCFVKNLKNIYHLFFVLISLLELKLQSYSAERHVCYFLYIEGLNTRFIYLFMWPSSSSSIYLSGHVRQAFVLLRSLSSLSAWGHAVVKGQRKPKVNQVCAHRVGRNGLVDDQGEGKDA